MNDDLLLKLATIVDHLINIGDGGYIGDLNIRSNVIYGSHRTTYGDGNEIWGFEITEKNINEEFEDILINESENIKNIFERIKSRKL